MAISSGNPVLKEKARVERADLRLLRVQKELQGQIRVPGAFKQRHQRI